MSSDKKAKDLSVLYSSSLPMSFTQPIPRHLEGNRSHVQRWPVSMDQVYHNMREEQRSCCQPDLCVSHSSATYSQVTLGNYLVKPRCSHLVKG